MPLLDHSHHSRREMHLELSFISAKQSFSCNINIIKGKGHHASACNSSSLDKAKCGEGKHRNSSEQSNKFKSAVSLILRLKIGSVFQIDSSTKQFRQRYSNQSSSSFVCFHLIQLTMNLSDKGFGKSVGLSVQKQIKNISLLLENGRLPQFIRSNSQELFDILDHFEDIICKWIEICFSMKQNELKIVLNVVRQPENIIGIIDCMFSTMHIYIQTQALISICLYRQQEVFMIKSLLLTQEEENAGHQFTRNFDVVSIRQHKRQEQFQKIRKYRSDLQSNYESNAIVDSEYKQYIQNFLKMTFEAEQLQELFRDIASQSIILKHKGVIGVRKILNQQCRRLNVSSQSSCSLFKDIVDSQCLDLLVQLAKMEKYHHLVLQASWCFTNLVSINDLNWPTLKQKGVLDVLIQLLNQTQLPLPILEHAIIAISNIAVDQPQFRDYFIDHQCINNVIERLSQHQGQENFQIIKNSCWMLSNLSRGSPLPEYQKIKVAIKYIACLVPCLLESNVLTDCLFALAKHINIHNNNFSIALETDLIRILVNQLNGDKMKQKDRTVSMRIIGNLSAGDDDVIEQMVELGALEAAHKSLWHPYASLRRETCWVLSNLAASSQKTVLKMVNFSDLLQRLTEILKQDEINTRKQACYIFSNLSYFYKDPEQYLKQLIEAEVIETLCELLSEEHKITLGILACLGCILKYFSKKKEGKCLHQFMLLFHRNNGAETLQNLQYSRNKQICKKVGQIIKGYFEVREVILINEGEQSSNNSISPPTI